MPKAKNKKSSALKSKQKIALKSKLTEPKEVTPKVKNYSIFEKALGFAELGRPIEWSKSLLNMGLGALMAFYIYGAGVNLLTFVEGFFAVAFLWSGLYALNDRTDWRIDLLHEIKKNRPIPSGKVSPNQGLIFSLSLILISYLIAFSMNNILLIGCLTIMVINQLLYTMKPFRFKSRKVLDVISGSMVNPIFRFTSGLVLFIGTAQLFNNFLPILPYIFVIGVQFGGYTLYRLFSKKHDKKLNMKSSVAMISEERIKRIAYFSLGSAVLAYIGLLINGLFFKIVWLGFLPPQYIWPALLTALLTPTLKGAILDPLNADMSKYYRRAYIFAIVFIITNLIVIAFFP